MEMVNRKMNKGKRRAGAALQAVGFLVMLAGLVYGVLLNPLTPGASAQASVLEVVAALTIGVFLMGFVIIVMGVWMSRIADARFGTV